MNSLLGHEKTLEVFNVLLRVSDHSLTYFFDPDLVLCLVDFLAFIDTGLTHTWETWGEEEGAQNLK
jgi:hypothetical protein